MKYYTGSIDSGWSFSKMSQPESDYEDRAHETRVGLSNLLLVWYGLELTRMT